LRKISLIIFVYATAGARQGRRSLPRKKPHPNQQKVRMGHPTDFRLGHPPKDAKCMGHPGLGVACGPPVPVRGSFKFKY